MAVVGSKWRTVTTLSAFVLSGTVVASEAQIPHKFTSGSPAVAAQVNENFDSLKQAIDDNHQLIQKESANRTALANELNEKISSTITRVEALEADPALTDLIVGAWEVKSFNNGFEGETGRVTFNADGNFVIDAGTVSVFYSCSKVSCPETAGVWEVLDGDVLKVTFNGINPDSNASYRSVFPIVVKKSASKLVFVRSFNNSVMSKQD